MTYSNSKPIKHPALLWSESDFQTHVLHLAKTYGYTLTYHTADSRRSNPGFPDLVLVHGKTGKLLFIELKTQVGRVSVHQESWINGLRIGGHVAEVWRPIDYVSGRIAKVLRGGAVVGRTL
ncbi:VRR-NUC domain-containing protein [Glutamicibacter sp.]|uniref:VRR-NUC domain-containing protein n=1 Tax=Glutamicibacter sp. TaxID=1931995 RepID=UPI0028BF0DC0|nr:VRR-NUC domain-containing protein [Glutamicibacter sp.]